MIRIETLEAHVLKPVRFTAKEIADNLEKTLELAKVDEATENRIKFDDLREDELEEDNKEQPKNKNTIMTVEEGNKKIAKLLRQHIVPVEEVTKEDIDECIRELNPLMFGGYMMPYPEYLANSKPLTEQQLQRNKEYFEKEYGLNAVPETITGDK